MHGEGYSVDLATHHNGARSSNAVVILLCAYEDTFSALRPSIDRRRMPSSGHRINISWHVVSLLLPAWPQQYASVLTDATTMICNWCIVL